MTSDVVSVSIWDMQAIMPWNDGIFKCLLLLYCRQMHISWHGQFTVKIGAKQGTIVLDPYAPSTGLTPFRAKADVVGLSSPSNPDMSHVDGITDASTIIDTPGEYSLRDMSLHGFSWHDEEGNEHSIMRWEIESMTLLHLGALRDIPAEDTLNRINEVNIDVLLVPIGGGQSLNTKQALDLVSTIEPRLVVPINFRLPKLKEKLDGVDQFAKEMGVSASRSEKKYVVKAARLSSDEIETIILQP